MNGGQSVYLMFPASADVQVSLGDKRGETHTNPIKELCKRTGFPRPPKAMEEELEHPCWAWGSLWFSLRLPWRSSEQKETLRGFRSMGVEQERDLCDSGTQRPGLLKGIPSEAEPPKPHFRPRLLRHLRTSPLCDLLIHPHLPGCMTVVSFSSHPRALLGSKKGDQIQLRDSKTCLLKKKKKGTYYSSWGFYNIQPSSVQ